MQKEYPLQKIYLLDQYTPIIHFQHDQDNATLRATELKPKLDRWLNKIDKTNSNNKTRRYKIRLFSEDNIIDKKNHPLYFGNMRRKDNLSAKEKFSVSKRGVLTLSVNTFFDSALADEIEEALPYCFAFENFGTRQSKGFGSFYCKEFLSIEDCFQNKKDDYPVYFFETKTPLDSIQALYKAMKPGINEEHMPPKMKNKYLKSLLWQYFNENQQINWEKRLMKQKLMKNNIRDHDIENLYIRGLLGLANNFMFRKTNDPRRNIYDARMDKDYGDKDRFKLYRNENFSVSQEKNEIQRFESPITFKPINDKVYIILRQDKYKDDLNKLNIQGETFTFKNSSVGNIHLKIPENFSLETFMDFVCNKINNNLFNPFQGPTAELLRNMNIQKI